MFIIIILCLINIAPSLGQRTPTISYISQEQIKDIGGAVELSCSVQYATEYPVLWTKLDRARLAEPVPISSGTTLIIPDTRFLVTIDPSTSTYTLHVQEIQETDAGYYRCEILISSNSKVSAEVDLQVRRPPIIFDNSTRGVVVVEGQTVKLECYAGGFPPPTVSWRREGNWVLPGGKSIYRGNVFSITSVMKDDRGTYYCVAENGVGRGSRRNIALEVQFAPLVSATRKRVGQALQFDMDLECKIEAYPAPAIIWTKDDEILKNNQHYEISHFTSSDEITFTVVRVVTVEKRQYGNYTCKAANIFGTSEATLELFETVIPMCPPACGNSKG